MEKINEYTVALRRLGAIDSDISALTEYIKNVFTPFAPAENPFKREALRASALETQAGQPDIITAFTQFWPRIVSICQNPPRVAIEDSAAGLIPVVYPADTRDFENILKEIVYKNKDAPFIENMGASFVFSKNLQFIILSRKPYSGVTHDFFGLTEQEWIEKSIILRRHHEYAHYYTKKFLGSSRNNLHDELIADFCGIYAAFSEYRPEWFLRFFDTRYAIYTKGQTETAARIIKKIAEKAALGVYELSLNPDFLAYTEPEKIEFLAARGLCEYY